MFGTRSSSQLTAWVASCESCRKNCTVTRIGRLWDAILVTDDGFGALMCQKCVQSQIRLGEWGGGGGGYHWGGGGAGCRRTENRDHIYVDDFTSSPEY